MVNRTIRFAVALLVTALTAVVGGMSVGRAGANVAGGRYLAVGDSIAFGYSPYLEDPWIPSRFVGYPEIIDRQTNLTTTNLACPGQTAQGLVSLTVTDGCFEARQLALDAGFALLHTDYRGTQLEAGFRIVRAGPQPAVVSIQGGGNEVSDCLSGPRPQACLADVVPKVAASMREAVGQLRGAGYRNALVLVGYHLPPGLEAPVRRVNRAVERVAEQTHVAFVDAARAFDQYARQHHGDLCSTGLLIKLPDGSCDLHPTRTGHALYAAAVLELVTDDVH